MAKSIAEAWEECASHLRVCGLTEAAIDAHRATFYRGALDALTVTTHDAAMAELVQYGRTIGRGTSPQPKSAIEALRRN